MKRLFLLFLVVALVGFTEKQTELSKQEKATAKKLLTDTRKQLQQSLKGLTQEQLNYKPSAEQWSIAQCVEHLVLSEGMLIEWIRGSLKEAANPAKRSEIKVTDDFLINAVENREQRVKTIEPLEPKSKFAHTQAAMEAFLKERAKNLAFVASTKDDLRNHFLQHPVFGTIDSYQGILILGSHTKRHTLQIEEVKSNPGFPKK